MYETVIKSIMRSASDSIPADWSNAFRMRGRRQIIQQRSGNIRTSWNPLRRRMKELKAQLGITETQSTEETQTAAETENQSQEMVSENQTTKTDVQQAENTDNSGDEMKILVLGDSIWGNYRDHTGVSARLAACLAQEGKNATVYNGAIGGTRATISPDDNEYQFGPASDCSLGKDGFYSARRYGCGDAAGKSSL